MEVAMSGADDLFSDAMSASRDEFGVLDVPIEAFDELQDWDQIADIVQWWWFNPLGCTMCTLRVWDSEDGSVRLVGTAQFHPRNRQIIVFAAAPRRQAVELGFLCGLVGRVFENYAWHADLAILPTLPTGVDVRRTALHFPRMLSVIESSFFSAARHQSLSTVLETCQSMENHPLDPYERTKHEVLAAIDGAARGKRTKPDPANSGPPTNEDLRRWWKLVTDSEHVELERSLVLRSI